MNSACIAAAASSAEACCSVEFVFRRKVANGGIEEFSVIEELGVRTEEDFEWERGGGLKVSFLVLPISLGCDMELLLLCCLCCCFDGFI